MTRIIKSMEESPLKRDESKGDCGKAEYEVILQACIEGEYASQS